MVPEIPLKIGNCQNNQAGSFVDIFLLCFRYFCDFLFLTIVPI